MRLRLVLALWLLVAVVTGLLAPAASAAAPQPRIIGGSDADQQYGFTVSIQRPAEPGREHYCGGALIDPQWVLTTAHCLQESPEGYRVRVGTNDRTQGGASQAVERVVTHPDYDGTHDDIGLMRLAQPVDAPTIRPALGSPSEGTPLRMLGWGKTCSTWDCPWDYPRQIRQLDTDVSPDRACAQGDLRSGRELCLRSTPQATTCYGDSGGPAIVRDGDAWRLAGLDGRGLTPVCGESGIIYTDVSAYRAFLVQHVGLSAIM